MRYVWLLLITIVITDPYSDIVYGEIDVYEFNREEKATEAKKKRKKRRYKNRKYREKKKIWCWMCDPPRFLYRK